MRSLVDDLSGSELRARLVQRGTSVVMARWLVMQRDTPRVRRRIAQLIGEPVDDDPC